MRIALPYEITMGEARRGRWSPPPWSAGRTTPKRGRLAERIRWVIQAAQLKRARLAGAEFDIRLSLDSAYSLDLSADMDLPGQTCNARKRERST